MPNIYRLIFSILLILPFHAASSQTWIPQGAGILPVGHAISSVSIVNESVVWATSSSSSILDSGSPVSASHVIRVLRTVDGGNTWQIYPVDEAMGRISHDIIGLDSSTAWITTNDYNSGQGKGLYKTEDGGETWANMHNHTSGGVCIRAFDSLHLICHNTSQRGYSSDGGESWTTQSISFGSNEFTVLASGNNMTCVVGDTSWVGTTTGRIIRTVNYGAQHQTFLSGFPGIQSLSFKNHLEGMLFWWNGATNFGLARTFDGGATWASPPSSPNTTLEYNVTYVPGTAGTYITATNVYVTGSEIFITHDFGENWQSLGTVGTSSNAIAFHSTTLGWVAKGGPRLGGDPIFFKYNGDPLTSVTRLDFPTLRVSIHPNPAAEWLHYHISEPAAAYEVMVYDTQGSLVLRQEQTQQRALDIKAIPPGTYYLQVKANGHLGITKFIKL